MGSEGDKEAREIRAQSRIERYSPDRRAVPLVDEDGEPITLEDALRKRDELLASHFGHREEYRQDDNVMSSIEAAKRLGRLQAHLALIGRK